MSFRTAAGPKGAHDLLRIVRMERPIKRCQPTHDGPAEQGVQQCQEQDVSSAVAIGEDRREKVQRDSDYRENG